MATKNHICFIGDCEFFRYDQTVRMAKTNSLEDVNTGFKLSSMFVCYLNSWERVRAQIEARSVYVGMITYPMASV